MWQYPTLLRCNWLTWILQETGNVLCFRSKSCREMVHSAVWSLYSACFFSIKNELLHFDHFRSRLKVQMTNEFSRDTLADSLLADQTTVFFCILHACPAIPAFKSNPCFVSPTRHSFSFSLFQLTVKHYVICNGNGMPWVKVTLCQNVILRFLPGYIKLALLFIQNQIRNTVAEPP